MTVENLYRAIGNMDDKYLEDLIKSETDIYNAAHSLDSSMYEERTIEVRVVKKKKRTISIILAAALLIGSVAAAAVFMGTRKDKKEYTEKKIENYFREDDSLKFSDGFSNFSTLAAVEDGMYFTSYYFTEDTGYKVSVYDNESDTFRNINLEGHSGKIYKMYSGENYLWIAAETENQRSELIRVDPETLKISDCTEFRGGEWISQIKEKEGGSAVLELFSMNEDRNITGWSFCTVDKSMKETDRTNISGETFPEDSLLSSCIRDEESGEYYMFFKSAEKNISMYKYNPEGTEIYHKDDITAGMDGTAAGFFLNISGNPVIMTHFWGSSGSDDALIQFNEFDSETGNVCGMYESDLNGCFPYIGSSSSNNEIMLFDLEVNKRCI